MNKLLTIGLIIIALSLLLTGCEFSASTANIAAALQFLPWLQDRLWCATITGDGKVNLKPFNFGQGCPKTATIITPFGEIEVTWTEDGKVESPANVTVELPQK